MHPKCGNARPVEMSRIKAITGSLSYWLSVSGESTQFEAYDQNMQNIHSVYTKCITLYRTD